MSRDPGAPKVAEQSGVCPKCGGELAFESDRLGYGQTIEFCVNWEQCGHWRTLEVIRKPAHAPAPRGEERPRPGSLGAVRRGREAGTARPSRRVPAAERQRFPLEHWTARVREILPISAAEAITPAELAPSLGIGTFTVQKALRALVREGVASTARRRTGGLGQPPLTYWRCA